MSVYRKIVLLCFATVWSYSSLFAFQDAGTSDKELAWYESFFQEKKRGRVERDIERYDQKRKKAVADKDGEGYAKALQELGLIHLTRTYDYDKAMDFFIRALALQDSLQLKTQQVFTYMAMARMFAEVSDFEKSGQFLEIALRLDDDDEVSATILNELGKVNTARGRTNEAFNDFKEVLEYTKRINSPKVKSEALFNQAHLFTQQAKYQDALRNHKQALAIRRSVGDRRNEALSLNDIGELYRLMKNDEKAMANHLVALEIRQALSDKRGMATSFNNIGVLYYEQKNFPKAIANLQLGLAAGQETQFQNQILRSYEYLSECYEALGDFKKALEFKDLFFAIHELIQGDKLEHQLLETQNRYVIGQKETQIQKLEVDRLLKDQVIREQKQFRNFLFVVVALIAFIMVLVSYFYILKRRSNRTLQSAHSKLNQQNVELQELNATKDKFFSIISHDLKGPLNSLTSFSNLLINYTESLSKEEIQMFAKDFDKSLKNLFALLENLLEWSRSQTGNIEFTPERFNLVSLLEENKSLLTAQAQQKGISITDEANGELFIHAHKNSVNTVVRNLISNAIKFTPPEGRIVLGVSATRTDVVVSIADNGVGMPAQVVDKLFRIDSKHSTKGTANEKGTGLGLILCKEFIEKNGGKIWVKSKEGEGSVFYFSLPYTPEPVLANA